MARDGYLELTFFLKKTKLNAGCSTALLIATFGGSYHYNSYSAADEDEIKMDALFFSLLGFPLSFCYPLRRTVTRLV